MLSTTPAVFAGVALLCIATPGPTMLLALSNGSRFGVRAALPGVAGAVASDFVLIAATAAGLGALLAASATVFAVVKWLGVLYLAYLGLRLLLARTAAPLQADDAARERPAARALFLRSFLVAATNPKGYLFFAALLPQSIDPAQPQVQQYTLLALIFAALDVVMMGVYAGAGERVVRRLGAASARAWIDRGCGAMLLLLAGVLALLRRPLAAA